MHHILAGRHEHDFIILLWHNRVDLVYEDISIILCLQKEDIVSLHTLQGDSKLLIKGSIAVLTEFVY